MLKSLPVRRILAKYEMLEKNYDESVDCRTSQTIKPCDAQTF